MNGPKLLTLLVIIVAGCSTVPTPTPPPKKPLPAPPPPPGLHSLGITALAAPPQAQELRAPGAENSFPIKRGDSHVLLVKRNGNENDIAEFHRQHGGKVTRFKHIRWDAVEVRGNAIERYKASPLFERIEFQRTYGVDATPNDPLFSQQWDLTKIEAPAAWDKATSNDVVVAVIDTGIDFNHPDLVNNLWTGPAGEHGYTASNGVITNGGRDDHFHGTHVAGTIAAVGNNGVGVAGINWRAKVVAFKFLTAAGSGSTRDAVLCIEKMIDLKQAGHNIRVSNNSWGGYGSDAALEDAFLEAQNAGILNVCAAGNNAVDVDETPMFPAAFPLSGIVSVLASDQNDNKAGFSNFGMVGTDILAPGVSILSCALGGDYRLLSGTSMASPHVAGAMAMVFAFSPTLTPEQAKTLLLSPASFDVTSFVNNSTSGGRLNLRKLWNNPNISNPPPVNQPPTLSLSVATNFMVLAPGQQITVVPTATDPDGDATAITPGWSLHKLPWFLRYSMNVGVPIDLPYRPPQVSVTGKRLGLDQNMKLRFSASDGHGGGAIAKMSLWTFRDESKVYDIAKAILRWRFWDDATGHPWFRLDVNTNYPALGSVVFDVRVNGGQTSGGGVGVPCCHPPNTDIRGTYDGFSTGTYRIRALVADGYGNFTTSEAVTYSVSNSTLRPPELLMTVSTNRGLSPLHVRADLSATRPGDAPWLIYGAKAFDEGGVVLDIRNPIREFSLIEPGVYAIEFYVAHPEQPLWDVVVQTFTVLPMWPAKLKIRRNGNRVDVSWDGDGILQEATETTGPYTDSADQGNPQTRTTVGRSRFFRLK